MVVTVGFLLGDATAKMAEVYPELMFGIIDFAYDPPIPNVQGIVFNSDEAAFLGGYLAAGMAVELDPEDPQIGWVGGMQIPPVEIFIVGYESGMAYYNAQKGTNVKAAGSYVGDFEAPDEGKATGNSLLAEGVDIIFGVGGKTGNGGLVAVREAAEAGQAVAGIGVDVDQYYTLPTEKGILLTSVEKRLDNAVFSTVKDATEGNFGGGGVYVGTLTNDGVGLAPYHDWEEQVPGELKAEVEALREDVIAGDVSTGWPVGEAEEPEEPAEEFKVGMISDVGGVDDASFNQTTWEGLERADQEIEGVTAQFLESQAQADYENNITEFAEQGYDMVVTVGFLLGDATAKMAEVYPELMFGIIDFAYDPPIPNVQGIVFNTDEAAFLADYLAAGMAVELDPDDPQIGWVGGMQIPPVEIFIVGYESGMAYYNAQKGTDVKSSGSYVGDFEAPDEGKATGSSLLAEGVDIIFGVGGKTGNGGLVAVREAAEAGQAVAGIGVDVDQYYTLPTEKSILLTSVEKKLDNAVFNSVKDATEGNFGGGGVYVGTLTNDGVGLAPYHDWEDRVSDELKAEIEALREAVIAGDVSTGWPLE
jgi:basic membrane protein A